jgi:adenylate kinase
MKLIIVGPPGSGKGTQSLRMSRALGIPHISTGASLRHAIQLGTPLGDAACECVAAGHLVPDELVTELVHERLGQVRARERGFLLDGFPRNQAQLDALLGWLDPGTLDAAIELAVPHDIVVHRLVARARTDDTEAGIHERLRAFERDTVPMVRDLDERGLLISVDADRPAHEVTYDILGALAVPTRSSARS